MHLVGISAGQAYILTEVSRGFPQSLQEISEQYRPNHYVLGIRDYISTCFFAVKPT
jgi:hypothetical protein